MYKSTKDIINAYQSLYPQLGCDDCLRLYANEAFLRRASFVGGEFLLKGSFVTREYFHSPKMRYPKDLDFVYLDTQTHAQSIEQKLSKWVYAVTSFNAYDGAVFDHFCQNSSWGLADYDDVCEDFQTLSTQIQCTIFDTTLSLDLDISIHLSFYGDTVPLSIHTLNDTLYFHHTIPITTQIAWKLHQSLLFTRLKDVYDLVYLLDYVQNDKDRKTVMHALLHDLKTTKYFDINKIGNFFKQPAHAVLENLNDQIRYDRHSTLDEQYAQILPYCPHCPDHLKKLLRNLDKALDKAGLNHRLITHEYAFLLDPKKARLYFHTHS